MARITNLISNFFRPLSGAQKALFGIVTAGSIILIGMLFYWALQPGYAVLFNSLSTDSAQKIVKGLKSEGVSYQLTDNGHTIHVPQNKVYNLRLKYADSEASNSDYKGFKLFDNSMLGMTDFMQRINKKRALEGELAHTINSLTEVKSSRVHIVLPKRSPFQASKVEPSASVLLNIKQNYSLSEEQIRGITALIAGSVAKLKPGKVVILDQHGNEISKHTSGSKLMAASSTQIRVRKGVEQYLTHKGQSMLNRVVGPGNSILRISVDLNFNKITRRSNTIDPGSRTIISEEVQNLQHSNNTKKGKVATTTANANVQLTPKSTTAQQNKSTVKVKNYVVSRTKKHFENTLGGITHISASVLLNYKPEKVKAKDGSEKATFIPRSKEEIAKIKHVMQSALGLQPKQGDVITVTQMKFRDSYNLKPQPKQFFGNSFSFYEMIRWILVAIIAAVIGFLMYRTSQKLKAGGFDINHLLEGTGENNGQKYLESEKQEVDEEDIYTQKLSDEAQQQLNDTSEEYRELDEFVENNTDHAARLVRRLMQLDK